MPIHLDPKRDRAMLSRITKLINGTAEPLPDPKPPRRKTTTTTTTTRKPSPVERIAAAGYTMSGEQDGRYWFENTAGDRTPVCDSYERARKAALRHIGEK